MRRLIDPARQARGDHEAGVAEIAGERLRELQSDAGGIAGADNGDDRPLQRIRRAANAEQRWCVVDFGQPLRITMFAGRNQANAKSCAVGDLPFGLRRSADPADPRCAAATSQVGQGAERGPRAAEMPEQRMKRARADILAADQPQPVEPLRVGQILVG